MSGERPEGGGQPAAGWYPDPENPDSGRPRWWDGRRWTDNYAPANEPSKEAWGGALWLFAIPGVVAVAHSVDRGKTSAYVIGSVFGEVVGSLLIALLIRFVYVKLVARRRRVWSPWTLVIASAVGLVALAGGYEQDGDRHERLTRAFDDAGAECDALGRERFPPLGHGLAYRPLTPAEERRIGGVVPPVLGGAFEVRAVTHEQQPVALMTVAPIGTDPGEAAAARRGFSRRARSRGLELDSFELDDGTGVPYTSTVRGGPTALAISDCYVRAINAFNLPTTRYIAERVSGG